LYDVSRKGTRDKDAGMIGNKAHFLLAGLVLPIAGLAQPAHAVLADTFNRVSPYVVTLSVGPTFESGGETQTIYVSPFIKKTYAANKKTNAIFDGEVFLGIERPLRSNLKGELGLAIAATSNATLSGDIWDFGNARFNNSSYTYQVQHTHIAAKGKLVADVGYAIKPYVSGSVGVGFNQAYDFAITPTIFAAVAAPNFTSTTTTAFTYTLGLGIQRTINEHWRAGVGYEFADWGKNQLGAASGQTQGRGLLLNHFYTNGIQLSLHYYHA
jgi:opacity protein-like surface antigen